VVEVLLEELRINAAGLKQTEEQLERAVDLLRKNQVAWSRIGEAIGTSRQAAWERFAGED
jgi:predicted HTH domain antitoxin